MWEAAQVYAGGRPAEAAALPCVQEGDDVEDGGVTEQPEPRAPVALMLVIMLGAVVWALALVGSAVVVGMWVWR